MSQTVPFVVHEPKSIPIADLNPAAYNPRTISPEKYEALKESIRTEGFVESVVVQKNGLRIIGGHQRVRAAKELSIEAGVAPPAIPCIVLDIDDVRAKKLNIKLNRLRGEFEARMLGELLVDIYEDGAISVEESNNLGFAHEEALKFMHIVDPPARIDEPSEPKSFGRSLTLSIEFATVEMRDRIKKLLAERATLEKKKTGDIVASVLVPPRARKAKKKAA